MTDTDFNSEGARRSTMPAQTTRYSGFLPLLILIAAWLLWSGFQSIQLLQERAQLKQLHGNQEQTVQTAQKMRQQLDAIAAGTKRLAEAGNTHAQQVVEALAERGVQINP